MVDPRHRPANSRGRVVSEELITVIEINGSLLKLSSVLPEGSVLFGEQGRVVIRPDGSGLLFGKVLVGENLSRQVFARALTNTNPWQGFSSEEEVHYNGWIQSPSDANDGD